MLVDNTLYDPDDLSYQDRQQAQVAACRAFYTEVEPLSVVDAEEALFVDDDADVVVRLEDTLEVSEWLRDWRVHLAFHPRVIEDERGVVLVLS